MGKNDLQASKTQIEGADSISQVLTAASNGWRLFPLPPREKKPRVKWKDWATTDAARLRAEFARNPQSNWGLATGPGSGVFIIDIDSDAGFDELSKLGKLPQAYTVKTSRGRQLYFAYPNHGAVIRNSAKKICMDVDVRGDGGYVVIPPSIHPSGTRYEVIDPSPVAAAPKWLLKKLIQAESAPASVPAPTAETAVSDTAKIDKGSRNDKLWRYCCSLRHHGADYDEILPAARAYNSKHCNPPLEDSEVVDIARRAAQYTPAPVPSDELLIVEPPFALMVPGVERLLKASPDERIFQTAFSRRLVRVIQHRQDPRPDRVCAVIHVAM